MGRASAPSGELSPDGGPDRPGPAIQRLPDLVRAGPAGTPVCLIQSLFTYHLSQAARDQFREHLRALGEERPFHGIGTGGPTNRAEHAVGSQRATVTDGELDVTSPGTFEAQGRWPRLAPES